MARSRRTSGSGWRLVVLGVAQDGGMPHLGCRRGPCAAARAGSRRAEKVACVGLTDGKRRAFVIDATPDFPAQVHALGPRLPEGVFLTHAHIGHYTGLVHLGKEAAAARGVTVYATLRMRRFLAVNAPWKQLVRGGAIDPRDNAYVDLDGAIVRAIHVPHRDELSDTVGYMIDGPRARVLYVPDVDRWEAWARDLRETVASVDVAILDGTFLSARELSGRDIRQVPHPTVRHTMDLLDGLGAKVWFTHLNHTNPLLDDPSPAERRGFHVLREGQTFPV